MSETVGTLPAPRTTDQVLTYILEKRLPTGWAWTTDPNSKLGGWFRPFADMVASIESSAMAQLQEVDPRTAVELLGNYEVVLGPDPAGRDQVPQTTAQQQAMVYQRWTARGGQSIAYYESVGASMGVPVSIADNPLIPWCGTVVCGEAVCAQQTDQFIWVVTLPASNAASAGVASMIQLYAPAHTECVIHYD